MNRTLLDYWNDNRIAATDKWLCRNKLYYHDNDTYSSEKYIAVGYHYDDSNYPLGMHFFTHCLSQLQSSIDLPFIEVNKWLI